MANNKRKRMMPLSLEELENNPCTAGLERVLLFRPPSAAPSEKEESIAYTRYPGAVSSPGDAAPPDDALAQPDDISPPGDVIRPGDRTSPGDITASGSFVADPSFVIPPSSRSVGIVSPGDATSSGDALAPGSLSTARPIPFSPQRQIPSSQVIYQDSEGAYVDPKRVRRATLVQHGHSPTEQLVYQILWQLGGGPRERDSYRDVQIGYDKLARQSGIHKRNIISIMHRLQQKLAIQVLKEQDSVHNIARQYRVYGMLQILERRRKVGMEYVVRHKGVDFVFPRLPGDDVSPGAISSPGDSATPGDVLPPANALSSGPSDALSPGPGDKASPLLGSSFRKLERNTSSSLITQALHESLGHSDDDAVTRIVTGCRHVCPNASEEEIVYFIRQHGPRLAKMKQISNPMGALITQIPKCFEGASFQRYRDLEQQRREAAADEERRFKAQQQAVLNDANASDEDKEWARQILGLESS